MCHGMSAASVVGPNIFFRALARATVVRLTMLWTSNLSVSCTCTTERIEERARELAAGGADVFAFPADLRDHARTHVLAQEVLARYGRLDILVNNAGMTQVGSPTETSSLALAELSEKEWDYGI